MARLFVQTHMLRFLFPFGLLASPVLTTPGWATPNATIPSVFSKEARPHFWCPRHAHHGPPVHSVLSPSPLVESAFIADNVASLQGAPERNKAALTQQKVMSNISIAPTGFA